MHSFSDFISIIEDQIQFFSEAAEVEQQKLDAARKNRITFVEDCMKKEQAMVLKLRGFDKNREEIQADLGFDGFSFQQIVDSCDEEKKAQLIPLMNQLNRQVSLFRNTCESAKSIIEINLHTVTSLLSQLKNPPDDGYSNKGELKSPQMNFTSRTI